MEILNEVLNWGGLPYAVTLGALARCVWLEVKISRLPVLKKSVGGFATTVMLQENKFLKERVEVLEDSNNTIFSKYSRLRQEHSREHQPRNRKGQFIKMGDE